LCFDGSIYLFIYLSIYGSPLNRFLTQPFPTPTQLKTIPPFLAQCSQLSILHLEGNQIDSLDVAQQGSGGSVSGDGGDGDSGGALVLAAVQGVRALDVTRFARFALGGNPLCVAAHEGNTYVSIIVWCKVWRAKSGT
jgi:hypothetical protein